MRSVPILTDTAVCTDDNGGRWRSTCRMGVLGRLGDMGKSFCLCLRESFCDQRSEKRERIS